MNPLHEAQELARRYNDAEAVWRGYEKKRAWRRLSRRLPPTLNSILDELDWRAAQRECRPLRAVGFSYPEKR